MQADIPDFSVRPASIVQRTKETRKGKSVFWEQFFDRSADEIFHRGGMILDIGGGLRIDAKRSDRSDTVRQRKFLHWLKKPNVRYVVSDYTDKYHPDFVEDIHHLSFTDGTIDAIFCLAVLEHVYDPKIAAEEIMRVLKPGGLALLYVPFIYRYHANVTEDYCDYYRYSKDAIAYLFRGCSEIEICPVRGLFESLLRFTPLHQWSVLRLLTRTLDWSSVKMRRISERQASGYFIRIVR